MKTIKSIFTLLMVNVISLIVVSCDKYESPLSGKTVADVTVESTFSTQTVSIGGANLTGFTATSSQSWCEVSTGESGVTLIVSSNETYDERKASVTVTDTEDGSILTFNVIQKQKDEINVGKLYKIPEKGGIFKIEVESNVPYTVEIPSDCDWLSQVSSTRGLSTTQITFNASKNDSGDERSTIVKVINKDAGITKEMTFVQQLEPYFKINTKEITAKEEGEEFEIAIETNVFYDFNISDNWVRAGELIEESDNKHIQKFIVSPLNGSRRTAMITFNAYNSRWSTVETVQITQAKALMINDSNVKIMIGESYDLNLINNSGSPVTWKSSNTRVAEVDSKGLVYGANAGSAIITVETIDGKYSDKIEVKVYDISDMITHEFSYGWTSFVTTGYAFSGYYLDCNLKNGSSRDINLLKCEVYANDKYLDTQNFNTVLKAGGSETVQVTNRIGISGTYTFIWSYEYNDRTYTYSCTYK